MASDAGFTQTVQSQSQAADSGRTRISKPSMTSIDLNSHYPSSSNKVIYIESSRGGARRGATDTAATSKRGTTSKTHIVESSQQHRRSNNRVADYDESFQSIHGEQQTTSRTNFPQNTDPKFMQTAQAVCLKHTVEENGPAVLDSARKHNQCFLDQVIAPIHTISKRTSTQSLSDGHHNLDERRSTESAGLAQLPSLTGDAMSNRASHTRQARGDQASKGSEQ